MWLKLTELQLFCELLHFLHPRHNVLVILSNAGTNPAKPKVFLQMMNFHLHKTPYLEDVAVHQYTAGVLLSGD